MLENLKEHLEQILQILHDTMLKKCQFAYIFLCAINFYNFFLSRVKERVILFNVVEQNTLPLNQEDSVTV